MADIVRPGEPVAGTLNEGAMPKNHNLSIYKGDYVELLVTVKDASGAAVDISTSVPKAQLKADYDSASPVEFDCTKPGPMGQVRIFLSSAVSGTLVPGSYIWDFQVTSAGGDTRTYLAGDVTVYPEVTTA